jgi:hypothetical protein
MSAETQPSIADGEHCIRQQAEEMIKANLFFVLAQADLGIELLLTPVNLDKLRVLTGAMLLVTAGTRNVVSCRDVSRHDD